MKSSGATDARSPGNGDAQPDRVLTAETQCAGQVFHTVRKKLDMYMLLDSSSSMSMDLSQSQQSKWSAVVDALEGFATATRPADTSFGLQLFPIEEDTRPNGCSSDETCGSYGPCFYPNVCQVNGAPCTSSADCPMASECSPWVGRCSRSDTMPCKNISHPCPTSAENDDCLPYPDAYCANGWQAGKDVDRCDVARFEMPIVSLAPLQIARPALLDTLNRRRAGGDTPLGPALVGSLNYLRKHASAHPDRHTVLVLVTDGEPSACTPKSDTEIAALLTAAYQHTPPVPTYVVGVLGGGTGSSQVHGYARAGGTNAALVLRTEKDLAQTFRNALEDIRQVALPCEFELPPADGKRLDYNQVNFEMTGSDQKLSVVPGVPEVAACTMLRGGWYYNEREPGQDPSHIHLCPATCERLNEDRDTTVAIRLGCKTIFE